MKVDLAQWGGLVLALCVAGCASTKPSGGNSKTEAKPAVINDRAIIGQMTREATRMMDSDEAVSMESLIEQLKKEPRAKLVLPAGKGGRAKEVQKAIAVVGGVYKCKRCTRWHVAPASGFLIAEDLVVTNYHVVDQPERSGLAVRLFDGRVFMVEAVVAASERFDLAVVQNGGDAGCAWPSGAGRGQGGFDQPSEPKILHVERRTRCPLLHDTTRSKNCSGDGNHSRFRSRIQWRACAE